MIQKKNVLFFPKVFVNEVDNDPASQAVEIVLNYIKKNPSLGLSVQLLPIEGNRTDSKKFLENSKFTRRLTKAFFNGLKFERKLNSECKLMHFLNLDFVGVNFIELF